MSRIAGSPATNPGCIFFLTSEKNPANGFHAKQKVGLFFRIAIKGNIKHLMTGPKGNSEFCFPETLNVPRGEAEGNIEVEGKQKSLFPEGPVIKCFLIPPNSK